MDMTFGERLKGLRQDADETQAELGKLLNVSARMISHYEKNEHFISDSKSIIEICKHYKVSADYLFGISNTKDSTITSNLLATYNMLSPIEKQEVEDFIGFIHLKHSRHK